MSEPKEPTESFLSKEQEVVVRYRMGISYTCERQKNGYWFCVKGKHRMLIDTCGYDRFVGVQ